LEGFSSEGAFLEDGWKPFPKLILPSSTISFINYKQAFGLRGVAMKIRFDFVCARRERGSNWASAIHVSNCELYRTTIWEEQ
jgi:hypothetical protein